MRNSAVFDHQFTNPLGDSEANFAENDGEMQEPYQRNEDIDINETSANELERAPPDQHELAQDYYDGY